MSIFIMHLYRNLNCLIAATQHKHQHDCVDEVHYKQTKKCNPKYVIGGIVGIPVYSILSINS